MLCAKEGSESCGAAIGNGVDGGRKGPKASESSQTAPAPNPRRAMFRRYFKEHVDIVMAWAPKYKARDTLKSVDVSTLWFNKMDRELLEDAIAEVFDAKDTRIIHAAVQEAAPWKQHTPPPSPVHSISSISWFGVGRKRSFHDLPKPVMNHPLKRLKTLRRRSRGKK